MKNTHLAASIERTATKIKSRVARMSIIMKPGLPRLLIALAGGSPIPLRRIALRRYAGFTLVELMLAAAILGILGTLAVSQYGDYKDKIRFAQAKSDIKRIETAITQYYADNKRFPQQLNDVGLGTLRDPWMNLYQYCELASGTAACTTRKDKSLHPLNSDFDLYSMGRDGDSKKPLTAHASRDDIIRASNGQFLGYAADF